GLVVLVFEDCDFPLGGMYDMAEKKAEELNSFEGVKRVVALERGEARVLGAVQFYLNPPDPLINFYWGPRFHRKQFEFPPSSGGPARNSILLAWIGNAELSVVYSRDFGRERGIQF